MELDGVIQARPGCMLHDYFPTLAIDSGSAWQCGAKVSISFLLGKAFPRTRLQSDLSKRVKCWQSAASTEAKLSISQAVIWDPMYHYDSLCHAMISYPVEGLAVQLQARACPQIDQGIETFEYACNIVQVQSSTVHLKHVLGADSSVGIGSMSFFV